MVAIVIKVMSEFVKRKAYKSFNTLRVTDTRLREAIVKNVLRLSEKGSTIQ